VSGNSSLTKLVLLWALSDVFYPEAAAAAAAAIIYI
jgi:hypothetical protein